jgi:hypothetical protein
MTAVLTGRAADFAARGLAFFFALGEAARNQLIVAFAVIDVAVGGRFGRSAIGVEPAATTITRLAVEDQRLVARPSVLRCVFDAAGDIEGIRAQPAGATVVFASRHVHRRRTDRIWQTTPAFAAAVSVVPPSAGPARGKRNALRGIVGVGAKAFLAACVVTVGDGQRLWASLFRDAAAAGVVLVVIAIRFAGPAGRHGAGISGPLIDSPLIDSPCIEQLAAISSRSAVREVFSIFRDPGQSGRWGTYVKFVKLGRK